jgi:hypothetical protein
LDQTLDLSAAKLVFEYASVQIYSIPARQTSLLQPRLLFG